MSLQDLALSKSEARYQAELTAAGDSSEARQQVEENYQKEQLEIQKKYADINFAIKASTIIADTAVASMRAFADLGPIAGAVAAALVASTGMIQLGIANQERKRIKSMSYYAGSTESNSSETTATTGKYVLKDGYSDGGYTGSGHYLEPAGIVHKDEYVIPAWQLKQPETINMVRVLESIRQSGGSSSGSTGFADGGFTGSSNGTSGDIEKMMSEIMDLLRYLKENGVKAPIVQI